MSWDHTHKELHGKVGGLPSGLPHCQEMVTISSLSWSSCEATPEVPEGRQAGGGGGVTRDWAQNGKALGYLPGFRMLRLLLTEWWDAVTKHSICAFPRSSPGNLYPTLTLRATSRLHPLTFMGRNTCCDCLVRNPGPCFQSPPLFFFCFNTLLSLSASCGNVGGLRKIAEREPLKKKGP